MLPFTTDAFFALFAEYNRTLWPTHVATWGLGLIALAPLLRRDRAGVASAVAAGALALLWAVNATAYHLAFFTRINPAAWGFGALFLAQAAVFAMLGVAGSRLRFAWRGGAAGLAGAVAILYALVAYPLIGWALGHGWPGAPVFGMAPCPTVIFTIGLLLCAERPLPALAAVIPLLWAVIGGSASWLLSVPEDLGLPAAGLALLARLLAERARRLSPG
ncbi:MAG: hypothetical protein IT557_00585 [Alphaproteobacteria bacterium]|nr:hypothetical protein [Alphaproteobacteria bacterium]